MKLIILKEKLKYGLSIVERISSKSLTLPILNNVLIKAKKNFLNLATTDLELGINWWSLAKVEQEGEITIPSKILTNYINLLPNKKINLSSKENILMISCENYNTQLKGLSPEEFPIIPQITEGEPVYLPALSFCQGLNQVVDIPIPSTARPEISGIYFIFQKDLLKIAATDSFRLGEKNLFLEKPIFSLPTTDSKTTEKEYSFILPQKTAKEIINIFGEKDGEIKVYFSPNQVLFEFPLTEFPHPEIQLVSRLIEGEYPNYQEIIPKKYETQIILQKNEFLNQIKLASLFSGKINEVKFKIEPKREGIEIFSQNPELGEYKSFLVGKIKGKAAEVSFNHRFLVDGLFNIKSSELIFELNGESGPGVLKPVGDPSYIYVAMPIKAS